MKQNILITGATGMLGSTLVTTFEETYNVYATSHTKNAPESFSNYKSFDLAKETYDELVEWSQPNVVIHCAALTNGNYCNNNPQEALDINGLSLQKMSNAVSSDTHIIYISTDAVFSNDTHFASEDTCVNPESVYGKSKELGEFFLKNSENQYTIVRTTIVGLNTVEGRQGFVEWIINSAKNQNNISLFDDVLFTPITIWNLAKHLEFIFNNKNKFNRKTLHVTGKQNCTKYDFGMAIYKALDLPTNHVKRGKITDFADRAKRSTDQTLDCKYFSSLSSIDLPTFEETINEIKINYNEIT